MNRFEEKIYHEPNTGCWLWGAGCDRYGYGNFWFEGRTVSAHRFAYELYVGPIPDGLHVCHTCDIPSCVNPDHLWLGTNQENTQDKVDKGRLVISRGEAHGGAKLTTFDVCLIRELVAKKELTQREAARSWGVHPVTISEICRRKKWAHV